MLQSELSSIPVGKLNANYCILMKNIIDIISCMSTKKQTSSLSLKTKKLNTINLNWTS